MIRRKIRIYLFQLFFFRTIKGLLKLALISYQHLSILGRYRWCLNHILSFSIIQWQMYYGLIIIDPVCGKYFIWIKILVFYAFPHFLFLLQLIFIILSLWFRKSPWISLFWRIIVIWHIYLKIIQNRYINIIK